MTTVRGLIAISGGIDTGKTSFALGMPEIKPEEILLFNSDVKDRNSLNDLNITHIDLTEMAIDNTTELKFHDSVLAKLAKIKAGQYKVIIFDTWTSVAVTFHAYVVKNRKKFATNWRGDGAIIGGKEWAQARRYETFIINGLLAKAPTVILTAHLKNHYVNQHKSELQVPAFSPAVQKSAVLKLWLRKNPYSPVPIALVEKRLSTRAFDKEAGRIETVSVLPQKLVPDITDSSLWDSILRYQQEPIGLREPTQEENLTQQEILDMAGVLSEDDMRTLMVMVENKPAEDDSAVTIADEAKALAAIGKSNMEIAKELSLTLPEITELLS